jgi:hypothetical protein
VPKTGLASSCSVWYKKEYLNDTCSLLFIIEDISTRRKEKRYFVAPTQKPELINMYYVLELCPASLTSFPSAD